MKVLMIYDRFLHPVDQIELMEEHCGDSGLNSQWQSTPDTEIHDQYRILFEELYGTHIEIPSSARTIILITNECNIYWTIRRKE